MINIDNFNTAYTANASQDPFFHTIIDDLLPPDLAEAVARDFPNYDDPVWFSYKNKLEDKKALNDWNKFPAETYKLLTYFNSPEFLAILSRLTGSVLYPDIGLHGGGWHIHGNGGKLNPHLDYSIHPKLGLQRKLNLIIYLGRNWEDAWGGHFGLWAHDAATKRPGKLVKEVGIRFNRGVLFDTTQNSWHGLSREVSAPEGVYRRSLAIYYLCAPPEGVDMRGRALFAPTEAQSGDAEIEALIQKRAGVQTSNQVYRQS